MRKHWLVIFLIALPIPLPLFGQDTASLRVVITDPSGAEVPDAKVVASESLHATQRVTVGGAERTMYVLVGLDPGLFRLEVTKPGFDAYVVEGLRLHARESQVLRISLRLSAAEKQTVTVTGEEEGIPSDPSTGMALDGDYLSVLPINSRSFTSLLTLTPGLTDAGDGPDGGIHSNGLRSNTNYYTIDGVSANTGVGGGPGPGPGGPGGGIGGSGANGTGLATNASGDSSNLISVDSIKEMQVQVSTFAPEFGRSPGAQVSITSRGGTNEYHGSAVEFFRNSVMNANDWFGNLNGLGRGAQRLNDVATTLGGPARKNAIFFFASFEGSHLVQPHTEIDTVPDNAVRARVKGGLSQYLNAFPRANGPSLGIDVAEFVATYSTPSTSSSESFRIDRIVNSELTEFLRLSVSPSTASSRGGLNSTANSVTQRVANTQSLTGGMTWANDDLIRNIRVNATRTMFRSSSGMDTFGGAQLLPDSSIFPDGINSNDGSFSLNVNGLGAYTVGGRSNTAQNQFNIVGDESGIGGSVTAKIGFDYRLLMPSYKVSPFTETVSFNGLTNDTDSLLSGTAQSAILTSNLTDRNPVYHNLAAYFQNTWKSTRYTTLTYGLRWDLNPAPSVSSGPHPYGLDSSNNLTSSAPLYPTRWFNIAPRFGLATELTHAPHRQLVLRGGVGMFYDTGYGTTAAAFSSPPYSNSVITTEPLFPLSTSVNQAPVMPPTTPYGAISGASSSLKSPVVYQFSATFEKNLGRGKVLSAGFVGSHGTDLLTTQTQPGFFTTTYSLLQLTSNGGSSDYRAFQTQFRQMVGRILTAQAAYTLGRSVDTQSNDAGFGGFGVTRGFSTGPSNYDIRHSITATASLAIPSPAGRYKILRPALGNWNMDLNASLHSSLPFDVEGQTVQSGSSCPTSGSNVGLCNQGFAAMVRPDLTGQPVWISDPSVPGGRRLNAAAFSIPSSGEGTEPRNALRGFGYSNVDLGVRKKIRITDAIALQVRAEAFNALNHPNFANPSPFEGANLADANFGIATRMLYNGSGGGSVQSSGAPRSVQLSVRVEF